MKETKIAAFVAATALSAVFLTSAAAFADPKASSPPNSSTEQPYRDMQKMDPIQRLQQQKANVQQQLRAGRITKDKADQITAEIDKKIKAIQDFNKLPLRQKKAMLLDHYKTRLDNAVREGKLTQAEADTKYASYKAKVDAWDGKGYPFFGRGGKGHGGWIKDGKVPGGDHRKPDRAHMKPDTTNSAAGQL